jgi:aspartate racemase
VPVTKASTTSHAPDERPAARFGLVGGIGPESTIAYYRQILEAYRLRRPDGGAPALVINSIDVWKVLGLVGSGDLAGLTDYLVREVNVLAGAGAEFGALGANSPHVVFDAVQARVTLPLISIVEATCHAARQAGFKRLGLFGTVFTMQGRFYPDVFSRTGIQLVTPEPAEEAEIDEIYRSELLAGIVLPASRDRLVQIARRLGNEAAIEGLILGGTELPLILNDASQAGLPLLDTTRIHVAAIVERMVG